MVRRHTDVIPRVAHWTSALAIIGMLSLGFYMTNTAYDLATYQLHKSLGVLLFVIVLVRLYMSGKYPWHSSAAGSQRAGMVNAVHLALLGLMVAMPVTGLMSSGFSGFSVHLFDLIIVPENFDASGDIAPFHAGVYQTAKLLHRLIGYAFALLVCGHVLAALKHHFLDGDATLTRMLFGRTVDGGDGVRAPGASEL